MLSKSARLLLLFLNTLILLIFGHFKSVWGWLFVLPYLYQLITYFRISSIWLSYRAYQNNDYEAMGKYLDQVPIPKLLKNKHQSMYYFLQGARFARGERENEAVNFLEKSLEQGLERKNDQAIALAMLATLYIGKEPNEKIYDLIGQADELAESEKIKKMLIKIRSKLDAQINQV